MPTISSQYGPTKKPSFLAKKDGLKKYLKARTTLF